MDKARLHEEKKTSIKEIFNQLWQTIRNMNEKLDKLTDLPQNLENKLNGLQTKIVQNVTNLNQLEEGKSAAND